MNAEGKSGVNGAMPLDFLNWKPDRKHKRKTDRFIKLELKKFKVLRSEKFAFRPFFFIVRREVL